MPRLDGKALGAAHGRFGGGATRRQRQPVARNRTPGPGKMDSERMEEGLRLCKRRRRHGIPDRLVIDGKFSGRVNPKDEYAVVDCKEPRTRRVLEFLVPLLYPEKPTRVTITVGNTIFGALSEERLVDWGVVVKNLVQRLLFEMGRSKATPICPYVFHLYQAHELLIPAEKEYRIKEAFLKHNVELEGEEDPESPEDPEEEESSDDSECESLTSGKIREIQKQKAARLKKSPLNKRKQPAAKEPVKKQKSPPPQDGPKRSYQIIAQACREIWAREREREALIQALCKWLGNVKPEGLLEVVDDLPIKKKLDPIRGCFPILKMTHYFSF